MPVGFAGLPQNNRFCAELAARPQTAAADLVFAASLIDRVLAAMG